MSQMNNNDTTSVAATLKLRNTETSALRRMPAADTTSSASAAARKTIKLKPLSPQTTGLSTENDPSSMAVASPLIKKVGAAPQASSAGEASPPQFMSTATAPVAKIPNKDKSAVTLSAPQSGASPSPAPASLKIPTGTTSIPRLNLTPKTTVAPTPSPAAAKTITLSPAGTPPSLGKPAENKGVTTASGSIPKYVATSTSALPKATPQPAAVPGQAPKYVSTATSPIPSAAAGMEAGKSAPLKDAIDQAKIQSGMQGAKPAIKLRPSANPDGPAAGESAPGAPTIKLETRTESGVTPLPPSGNAPAVKSSDTMTAKISRKGVSASASPARPAAETPQSKAPAAPVSASAPTVELATGVVEETQKALDQAAASAPAPAPAPAPTPAPATASDPGVTTKIPRKLGIKKPEAPAAAPSPSAPTVKTPPVPPAAPGTGAASETKASAEAEKPQKPAAPTLRQQDDIAKVNLKVSGEDEDQALSMGQVEKAAEEEFKPVKKKTKNGEPHIFFAVCVIVAFVVTLFTVYTLVAHYLNTWEGKDLPVVGFEQIDAHLKKK